MRKNKLKTKKGVGLYSSNENSNVRSRTPRGRSRSRTPRSRTHRNRSPRDRRSERRNNTRESTGQGYGRIKSKTSCRHGSTCRFKENCDFLHIAERMGNNMGTMRLWGDNTDPDDLLDMEECELFHYKLTTALTMMSYFLMMGIPIGRDFFEENDYIIDFIRELKERGEMDKFPIVYKNINHFLDTLKRVHTKVSLRNVLTDKTRRIQDSISLWRGFRSNYNMFLDNLHMDGDTLQTPIILATSLSENVSYRFVGFNRIVPTIWKINVPRDKLRELPGTIFETEDYNINLRRPAANREFEVILPMDSILKFKRKYRGKTSFETIDIFQQPKTVDISSETPVTVFEWDFVGIGQNIYQSNFMAREDEVIGNLSSLIRGVGKRKSKNKKNSKSKKSK